MLVACVGINRGDLRAADNDNSNNQLLAADRKKVDSLNALAFDQKRFDVAKALNNLFNAENLALAANYPKGLATTYFYEAGIYHQNGYDKKALSTYYKAKQIFQGLIDTLNIAIVNKEIATALYANSKSDEAILLYNESLSVFTKMKDSRQIANVKNSIGLVHLDQKKFEEATQDFTTALNISIKVGHQYGEKKAYYNLGLLEERRRNFAMAETYYRKSLAIDKEVNDKFGAALNELQLSSISNAQQKRDESIALAKEAYSSAYYISAYNLMREASVKVIDGYRQKGEIIQASVWQDSLVNILKEQIENEKEYALNYIEVIKSQNAKNTNAEKDLEKQKQVQKEQLLIITVGTFILIIVAVLAVLALVNYQRQRFFGKELKQKNEIIEKNSASLDQLNKEISHQNLLLEADNKTKNKLLSIISHDLRTPLVNTKGVLNLVNQGMVPPEEADRLLQLLETQYLGTTSLLDNLLFWIKGQMDGKPDDKVKVGLHQLVKVLEEEHRMPLLKKKIELRNLIDKELAIVTEKEMIRIVCRNLISNAIKFSNENGIIEVSSRIGDDHFLYMSVKDNGIGMSKETIDKVNAKQYYNTTGTSYEKGSGFGLMLCRDLLNKAGGDLIIESEPGVGSTFTIKMPVA
ncbi:MAG: tetratricopeptide repeat-containing sensor histidine kinase [Bacteroidota bacterium]|nr:tetratricopeptide repeat-containing sensor histidine kinase [Bacteroidota bacterium]